MNDLQVAFIGGCILVSSGLFLAVVVGILFIIIALSISNEDL